MSCLRNCCGQSFAHARAARGRCHCQSTVAAHLKVPSSPQQHRKAQEPSNSLQQTPLFKKWTTELKDVEIALHKALFPTGNVLVPSAFLSARLKSKVHSVVDEYNYLASKLTRDHHQHRLENGLETQRITGTLLAQSHGATTHLRLLASAQSRLLKSHCLRFHSLLRLHSLPREAFAKGFDNLAFTTRREQESRWTEEKLKNTRYGRSTKSHKVRTELPLRARVTPDIRAGINRGTNQTNAKLMAKLWPQLKSATFKKMRMKTVSCQWEQRNFFGKNRTMYKREVAQLRDRVMALMVETAVHPIAEYQADPHSFGWRARGRRSASMANKYLASLLEMRIDMSQPKRPIRIIKVNLVDAFETISHEAILDSYPLVDRYQPFLSAFLKARRRGYRRPFLPKSDGMPYKARKRYIETETVPTEEWCPSHGVMFDSILGRSLVNNALDGVEEALLRDLPSENSTQDSHSRKDQRMEDIHVIRYGTSIVVLGVAERETFEQVSHRLRRFLEERNLASTLQMKGNSSLPIFSFRPGVSFDFLGHKYLYQKRGHGGRFSREYWSKTTHKRVIPQKLQVVITNPSMMHIKETLENSYLRSRTQAKVENIIRRSNQYLERIAAYFAISHSAYMQLRSTVFKLPKLFRKLVRRKFRSKPKLGTMIRETFYREESGEDGRRIAYEDEVMLKLKDLDLDFYRSFVARAPRKSVLKANVYLDLEGRDGEMQESGVYDAYTPTWINDDFAPQAKMPKTKLVGGVNGYMDEEELDDASKKNEWGEGETAVW